jgi:DNA modification methylase
MSVRQARFVFKLRRNTVLEGDLALARAELEAFLHGAVHELPSIAAAVQEFPQMGRLRGLTAPESYTRPSGAQAMAAGGPLSLLPRLIRRLSFVQRIYCVAGDTGGARGWLDEVQREVGPVVAQSGGNGSSVIQAVPHYALFELSGVVCRRSKGSGETKRNLAAMLDALLERDGSRTASRLARDALSAGSATSHLSHGVHYYKAKFFPRLARSILNVCVQRLGEGPRRLVDPFVGSGTALLEAATLGIPSVGLDIDPLSVLISRTKLGAAGLDSALLARETARAVDAVGAPGQGRWGSLKRNSSPEPPLVFPAWLMKNRRMTAEVADELKREIEVIQAAVATCDPGVRPLFRVLMSDAISRRIRMRFLGTGVGRFSLTISKTPATRIFARSLQRYVNVVAAYEWLRETVHLRLAEAQVVEADARVLPRELGDFDILLTSPPYLPASSGRESYARARAPSLIALGIQDANGVDELAGASVGSMGGSDVCVEQLTAGERSLVEWLRNDSLRSIKAGPTARYFLDMRRAFGEMFRVLRPGGLAVVVSGKQSTFYRSATRERLYVARSAEFLAEEAERAGFALEAAHDIQLQKSGMNARPRSLDDYYETLIMLRRPG